MLLQEVKTDKKHCCRVCCDDGKVLFIDTDVVAEYGLKAGISVDDEKMEEIVRRSDFVRAKERALFYLDHADHTEKALFEKLTRAGFAPQSCAAVMAWLKRYGMVDDRRFAARFAERCSESNISRRDAYQKMLQKGVPRDLARETTETVEFDEPVQLRALIEKKYRNKLGDRAANEKVFAALVRKGFSFGAVRTALKEYGEEIEYSEESV